MPLHSKHIRINQDKLRGHVLFLPLFLDVSIETQSAENEKTHKEVGVVVSEACVQVQSGVCLLARRIGTETRQNGCYGDDKLRSRANIDCVGKLKGGCIATTLAQKTSYSASSKRMSDGK